MSMPHLRESIEHLLYLQRPLPRSLARELRVGNKSLLRMHDQFMDIASELRIWTFYETIETQLSGFGSSDYDEVHFSAPLTSIKSGLLGSRSEQALSLESDHAHCASFGPNNIRTMHSFLADLGAAVRKAEELSTTYPHTPLRLSENVKIELIGFYGDPDIEANQEIRLYISKHILKEFIRKGPEVCLQERMNTVAARRHRNMLPMSRMPGGLGILGDNGQEFDRRALGIIRPGNRENGPGPGTGAGAGPSPEIVVSRASRPSIPNAATEPMPVVSSMRSRGLTVPALATPVYHRPSSRSSNESTRTTNSEPVAEVSPKTPDPTQQLDAKTDDGKSASGRRARRNRGPAFDTGAGFSRPEPSRRKFMWMHLPFNNPHWVKVNTTCHADDLTSLTFSRKSLISLLRHKIRIMTSFSATKIGPINMSKDAMRIYTDPTSSLDAHSSPRRQVSRRYPINV